MRDYYNHQVTRPLLTIKGLSGIAHDAAFRAPSRITEDEPLISDERTEEEQWELDTYIIALDKGMSGWGRAPNRSFCAWACAHKDRERVLEAVQGRGDMRDVHIGDLPDLQGGDHLSIYAVRNTHPYLQ